LGLTALSIIVSAMTTLLSEAVCTYCAIDDGTVAAVRFANRSPYLPCDTVCISVVKNFSTVPLGALASTMVRFEYRFVIMNPAD
jgi:hypothetical protein